MRGVAAETFDGTDAEFWERWLADASLDRLHALLLVFDEHDRPAAWVASERATDGGRPGFYAPSRRAAAVARDVADALGQGEQLDPATLIVHDAYASTASGLWARRPTSNRPEIDAWLDAALGPRDAIILVAESSAIRLLLAGLRKRRRDRG